MMGVMLGNGMACTAVAFDETLTRQWQHDETMAAFIKGTYITRASSSV